MNVSESHYREVLQGALDGLCKKNGNYSLRSFAKKLKVSPSTLSRVLSGQRSLSVKHAERIAAQIVKGKAARALFVDSAILDYRRRQSVSENESPDPLLKVDLLGSEQASPAIALLCFTLLELTFTEAFDSDAAYLSERTGYSRENVQQALDVLTRTGLLQERNGILEKTAKSVHLRAEYGQHDILNGFYRELFGFAANRAQTRDPAQGAMVSLTLPSDPDKISLARTLMENFSWKLCQILAAGENTEVYHLGMFIEPATVVRRNRT